MATYMVKSPTPIEHMEGDHSVIEIFVPADFDITGRDVRMQVRATNGMLIFGKSTVDGSITVSGQYILIPVLTADTLKKSGFHLWEIEVQNVTDGIITIGNGPFTIKKQVCIF